MHTCAYLFLMSYSRNYCINRSYFKHHWYFDVFLLQRVTSKFLFLLKWIRISVFLILLPQILFSDSFIGKKFHCLDLQWGRIYLSFIFFFFLILPMMTVTHFSTGVFALLFLFEMWNFIPKCTLNFIFHKCWSFYLFTIFWFFNLKKLVSVKDILDIDVKLYYVFIFNFFLLSGLKGFFLNKCLSKSAIFLLIPPLIYLLKSELRGSYLLNYFSLYFYQFPLTVPPKCFPSLPTSINCHHHPPYYLPSPEIMQ